MQVTTVVFDKRGTLTSGHPSVSSVRLFVEDQVLSLKLFFAIIGVAEGNCTHPIARAVTEFVQKVNKRIIYYMLLWASSYPQVMIP